MRVSKFRRMILIMLVVTAAAATATAQSPAVGLQRLRLQIEQAIAPARGDVGVAIKHLESGQEIGLKADEPYPMASTFKLPILVELHAQAKTGAVKWDEVYQLQPADQHLGSGDIPVFFDLPGVGMSLRNVANMMMMISDNSATDILLARVGGAAKVTARMRDLGLNGIRVDRSTQELILDFGGQDTERLKGMLLREMRPLMQQSPNDDASRLARETKFANDPRDQATPRDMNRLLEMIWRGQVVDSESSNAILELMKRCRTGGARIKGLLPANTVVAHKTGSIGGTINNVGIIYLPHNAGHVAISVLSKRTRAETATVERVIAEIARYAYDYFVFTASGS